MAPCIPKTFTAGQNPLVVFDSPNPLNPTLSTYSQSTYYPSPALNQTAYIREKQF